MRSSISANIGSDDGVLCAFSHSNQPSLALEIGGLTASELADFEGELDCSEDELGGFEGELDGFDETGSGVVGSDSVDGSDDV